MKKKKKVNMGSVSQGTYRTEDLIPAFVEKLKEQKPLRQKHRELIAEIQESTDENQESAVEDLIDALNEYAPIYFYFGTHSGNDSDYGFWLEESFVEEFEGLKVESTSEVPKGYTGEVLQISDHGNLTLYKAVRGRLFEIWAIV